LLLTRLALSIFQEETARALETLVRRALGASCSMLVGAVVAESEVIGGPGVQEIAVLAVRALVEVGTLQTVGVTEAIHAVLADLVGVFVGVQAAGLHFEGAFRYYQEQNTEH